MLNIQDRLVHVASWSRLTTLSTLNEWGQRTEVSTAGSITCFCYYQDTSRQNAENVSDQDKGWHLLLPPTASFLVNGDRIENIRNSSGVLIYEGGKISRRLVYDHRSKGVEFLEVVLEPN